MTSDRKGALAGMIILAVVALYFGVMGTRHSFFLGRMQTTVGTVEKVREHTQHRRRGRSRTRYDISYSYTVNEVVYHDSQDLSSNSGARHMNVYYDAADPQVSYIQKPSPKVDYIMAVIMLCVAGGLALKFFGVIN